MSYEEEDIPRKEGGATSLEAIVLCGSEHVFCGDSFFLLSSLLSCAFLSSSASRVKPPPNIPLKREGAAASEIGLCGA
jgi:hypothetical protein